MQSDGPSLPRERAQGLADGLLVGRDDHLGVRPPGGDQAIHVDQPRRTGTWPQASFPTEERARGRA
eukprot:3527275-Lingulodinium_polyedra.AAC.1